jgi:hypothetical protein
MNGSLINLAESMIWQEGNFMLTWNSGITKTLTPTDASCFTWYIRRVGQYKILTDYAKENGYNDLLMLYDRFKPIFQTKEHRK